MGFFRLIYFLEKVSVIKCTSFSVDNYHVSGQRALKDADRWTLCRNSDGAGAQGTQTLVSVLPGTRIARKPQSRGQLLGLWLSQALRLTEPCPESVLGSGILRLE